MLILERKTNEEIVIDGHIVVCVLAVRGDKVRLGVAAPQEMPVHRREVQDAIDKKFGGRGY